MSVLKLVSPNQPDSQQLWGQSTSKPNALVRVRVRDMDMDMDRVRVRVRIRVEGISGGTGNKA